MQTPPFRRSYFIFDPSITSMIRPSPYIRTLQEYSVNREISLSFGERPLTSYPGFRPNLYRIGCLQISPSIQNDLQLFPQCVLYGYFHRLLPLYRDFSPSKHRALGGVPFVIPAAGPASVRVIPTPWASIAAPGRPVRFHADTFATAFVVDGFRLLVASRNATNVHSGKYPIWNTHDILRILGMMTGHSSPRYLITHTLMGV